MSEGLGSVVFAHTELGGTISEDFACTNEGSTSFPSSTSLTFWNGRLSGTLPECMFDGAQRLTIAYWSNNRFQGQIPQLHHANHIWALRFEGNDFDSLPKSLPPNLRMFNANNNPRIVASGADVAALFASATYLQDFSVTVDTTLAFMQARAGISNGPLPDIGWTAMHPKLPVDCRFGEQCGFEFTIVVGLDYVPQRSMGIEFEVRMSDSPTDLNDQIISIGHHITNSTGAWSSVVYDQQGRRRAQQADEADDLAQQTEQAEDLDEGGIEGMLTGETRHMANHSDSLNLTRKVNMVDSDDGYISVTFPADWFHKTGKHDFRVFGTINYCVANESGKIVSLPSGSCQTDARCDCSAHVPQLIELYDKSLWFVNMHPIRCSDPLATPNAAGSTCQCPPGSAPNDPCQFDDSHCECIRCSDFGDKHYSPDGVACKQCAIREIANANATGCQWCEELRSRCSQLPLPPPICVHSLQPSRTSHTRALLLFIISCVLCAADFNGTTAAMA